MFASIPRPNRAKSGVTTEPAETIADAMSAISSGVFGCASAAVVAVALVALVALALVAVALVAPDVRARAFVFVAIVCLPLSRITGRSRSRPPWTTREIVPRNVTHV